MNFPYLSLNLGFTPLSVSALMVGEGRTLSCTTTWGTFEVLTRTGSTNNVIGYDVKSDSMTASNLTIPVGAAGTYHVLVCGYY